MSQPVTMSTLRTRVLRRADMENTTFIGTAAGGELDQYIQKSWEKLYNYLVGKYEDYFIAFDDLTALTAAGSGASKIEAGEQNYILPADFFKLLFLGIAFDGSNPTELTRATWRETGHITTRRGRPSRYHLAGIVEPSSASQAIVILYPTPDADYTAGSLIYVPIPPIIPESTGGVDFVAGWDEYVVLDAAIKCLGKEESDTTDLKEERADWLAAVENAMSPRDAGQPHHVVALERMDLDNEDLAEMFIE